MSSIGGLAQYLNTYQQNTPYQNTPASLPSALLGGSTSGTGASGTSDTNSLLTSLGLPTYAFPTDSNGQPLVATLSDMQAATQPGNKLTIAGQVAEAIRMQSDCSVQGGCANRLTDMATQTQTLLDAVTSVVGSIATSDGSVPAGQPDPAVTPYQSAISTVLGRVASVAANLQVLTSKATPDVAGQAKTALALLNTEASTIASQAGLDWSSLSKAGMNGLISGTASTTVPRLLDYLA